MNDLFDINIFEESDMDDILNSKIEENVTIPGGDKESPNAKPEGGEKSISVPGGDGEKPTAKPEGGEKSIPTPGAKDIPIAAYNEIIGKLQKSFKESSDILLALQQYVPVEESVEELQESYTEDFLDKALYESFMDGPIFEAVKDENKDKIKKAVRAIQGVIDESGAKWHLISSGKIRKLFSKGFHLKSKAWQTVGVFYAKSSELKDVIAHYKNEFKDQLDGLGLGSAELILSGSTVNPHIQTRFGMGLLVALIWPASKILKVIAGVSTAGNLHQNQDSKMKKKTGGKAYLLVVTNGESKVDNVEVELSEADIKKGEKILDSDKKEDQEIKEYVEAFANGNDEDDDTLDDEIDKK